eukprot:1989234-Rhodomonas_salina.1
MLLRACHALCGRRMRVDAREPVHCAGLTQRIAVAADETGKPSTPTMQVTCARSPFPLQPLPWTHQARADLRRAPLEARSCSCSCSRACCLTRALR